MAREQGPARMGHEFIGIVEDTGSAVSTLAKGDLVVAPFVISDGTCEYCREGLQTSCVHGSFWDTQQREGGRAEAVRAPWADGTLVKLPVAADSALIPRPRRRAGRLRGDGCASEPQGARHPLTADHPIGDDRRRGTRCRRRRERNSTR